jgi:hypothetical protein
MTVHGDLDLLDAQQGIERGFGEEAQDVDPDPRRLAPEQVPRLWSDDLTATTIVRPRT